VRRAVHCRPLRRVCNLFLAAAQECRSCSLVDATKSSNRPAYSIIPIGAGLGPFDL